MHTLLQRDPSPAVDSLIELGPHSRLPRLDLGIDWESPREGFITSLRGVVSRPRAPREAELTRDRGFHVDWISGRLPGRAFAASSLWHVAVIWLLVLPIWGFLPAHTPTLAPVQIELTWYARQPDLPRISLPAAVPREKPKNSGPRVSEGPGADPPHARQTILSIPVHVTHPRQTLIRPDAPSAPPKVVPQLPNIVQWSTAQPQKPRFQLSVANSAPKIQRRAIRDDAPPEVPNSAKNLVPFNIVSKASAIPRPKMPVSAMSAPVARQRETHADATAAPEIGAAERADSRRIIALSATPAPLASSAEVPEGNLAARISVSPEGKKPGAVANSTNHSAGPGAGGSAASTATDGSGVGANSGSLPAAVSIDGGVRPSSRGGIAPSGSRLNTLNLKPPNSNSPPVNSRRGPPNVSALDPSLPPEKILSGSEVYTMHVNLPNLTSVSGSWILSFAELDEGDGSPFTPRERLAGPVPIRKADPKYPSDLIKAHVQGEVVLYAIIRKDGSVDSIQVVRGLDPQLDQNAIQALGEWKFRPATRAGHPVDVEAVVHIPFLYQDPRDYGSR
ncbi:MAG TPA: TonB family protein [Candidatus Acidoferrales bacterium]|nr:TonB family protein [Candidatus Acidoferrales bacterium]